MRHESSDAGNLNELGRLLAVIAQGAVAELSNGKCCALGIDADAFCSCHLHGLDLDQFLALEVAACCGSEPTDEDHQQAEARDRTPHRRGFLCSLFTTEALGAGHPPECDTGNEGTGNKPSRCDDVGVLPHEDRVGDNLEEASDSVELCTARFGVKACADGVLHPRVRAQDPQCREHRAEGNEPDAGKVPSLGKAAPSKDPQTQEG